MRDELKKRIAQINAGIVPAGYRKTKVGIVPEDWDIQKAGKYIVEHTEKSTENNQYPVLTSSRKGLFLQSDYYNKQVASEDNTGYNVVPYGFFTYRHMSDDEIFKFNINLIVEKGIVSTLYPVFTLQDIDKQWFLYTLNNGREFPRYARAQKQGGSRTYMYLEKLKKLKLALPPLPEQQKIAEILTTQDEVIALIEKQIELLKKQKQAYLQKMFPKKGSKYPEIRFAGFTDAWEQRKFGDVNDLITGYPFESEHFSETGINLIRGMNVKRGSIDLSNDICVKWNSSKGLESYLLKENDIIIQMDGALIGKSYGIIKKSHLPALLVQRVTRARTNSEIADSDFMYQTIQRDFLTYINMNKTETAVPHLSLNDIRYFRIMTPNLSEQKMIGAFFANLDNLITLHQRKLELEQQQKKALMQLLLSGKVRVESGE